MFKFKRKTLISFAVPLVILLLLSSLTPALRPLTLNILKYPFSLITICRREISGIIFYHRNMMQAEGLRKENDSLRQAIRGMDELYLENKRLTELFSFKQKLSYRVIPSRVIARSPDNWSSLIISDRGSSQGIKRGFVVVTYAGLVGRVAETTQHTSKIALINDPELGVSAIIQRSRQEGLVSGTLGNYLIMKYLPKESDVKAGDAVLTSGLTGVYPKGLIIGEVVDVGEEFSGLSRYAVIKPAVNLANVEEILIIIP